jgi:tetratricopeptide (TPR) repeat protein
MNKINPTLKETFHLAYQHYKKQEYELASSLCSKILNVDPNHFDSNFLLSSISAIMGDFEKSKIYLTKAIEIQPNNVNAYNNLGNVEVQLKNLNKAKTAYEKVISIMPNHLNAHSNLGILYYNSKNFADSIKYFKKAIEINPRYGIGYYNLGNVYVELKNYDRAISSYQKAVEINPKNTGALNNLGLTFRATDDLLNAVECYKKVLKIKADHAGTHHNLAMAYKEMGEFDKAIDSHNNGIKYEPNNMTHYFYLSDLKEDIINQNLQNKIEKEITRKNTNFRNLAYGNFLLARCEKKKKEYQKEINYLIKGHEAFFNLKKEKFELGVKYVFKDVIQISESINSTNISSKSNHELKPIFIVGVPRCGSTVIEKIIASGTNSLPMSEESTILENFVNKKILEKESINLGSVDILKKEIYELYKQKGVVSKNSNFIFTDKSLNNFFYIGIIKDIFPEAKIINCKRDFLSSIVSILQNNLTELAWAHSIENIFKYFDIYLKTVKNFKEVYPGDIYDLQFEDFINDPETESKKLMNHCGLKWNKKCLEFHKRKDLVSKTASNIQIRKAIYKDPSDKYLPYKKLLSEFGKNYSWYN